MLPEAAPEAAVELEEPPAVKEQHPVRHGTGKLHLVGNDDHRLPFPRQVQHDVQHLADHFGVEGGGHFVKEQDLRVHTQCPHNGDALLLAAGKLPRVALGLLQKAHPVQQGFGLLLYLGLRALLHLGRGQQDVIQHGQVREELVALEHHADALAQGL